MGPFDVIVVGAGHAGCEAAAAAARLGRRTLCVTLRLDHVGRLSCNPAVGGLAKGHLVRELDALGGLMARVTDQTSIQFRRLNTRKGLAVQSSRAQVDIHRYPQAMRRALDAIDGLVLLQAEVAGVLTRGGRVAGIQLGDGVVVEAPAVVLTTGTFLGGVMHCGSEQVVGGRAGDAAAHRLSASLADLGLRLGRLKTGTTPRLDARTIAWDRLRRQEDTLPDGRFSFSADRPHKLPQVDCHLASTNPATHDTIREALADSPVFNGQIEGRGPRYCPSIEDKVVRFADKDSHLIFLEPEGLDTDRVYPNGLSTSLPLSVQQAMLRTIEGLQAVEILQPGYAVEYDFADPRDLGPDLQHREVEGLFLAGQVNGTSGYEEAAVQGFVAGVSAATGQTFHVERDEGYLGVLIDDLVSKGVGGEPYRMFTSRAEHRLILREDNADRRLMPRGRALGLVDDATWAAFEARQEAIARGKARAAETFARTDAGTLERLAAAGVGGLKRPASAEELLRRPGVTWSAVADVLDLPALDAAVAEQIEIDIRYAGYVERARRKADKTRQLDRIRLPEDADWHAVTALSFEARERLCAARPRTVGQAARLPGITPAAVDALVTWAGQQRRAGASA